MHYLHRQQRIGEYHSERSLNTTVAVGLFKIIVSILGKTKAAIEYRCSSTRSTFFLAALVYVSVSIERGIGMLPIETSLYLGAIQERAKKLAQSTV